MVVYLCLIGENLDAELQLQRESRSQKRDKLSAGCISLWGYREDQAISSFRTGFFSC